MLGDAMAHVGLYKPHQAETTAMNTVRKLGGSMESLASIMSKQRQAGYKSKDRTNMLIILDDVVAKIKRLEYDD